MMQLESVHCYTSLLSQSLLGNRMRLGAAGNPSLGSEFLSFALTDTSWLEGIRGLHHSLDP